jgi:isoleucyl-tRNA synthetase
MMAPVLTFTSEELWQHMRNEEIDASLPESVQLADWPEVDEELIDDEPRAPGGNSVLELRRVAMAAPGGGQGCGRGQ